MREKTLSILLAVFLLFSQSSAIWGADFVKEEWTQYDRKHTESESDIETAKWSSQEEFDTYLKTHPVKRTQQTNTGILLASNVTASRVLEIADYEVGEFGRPNKYTYWFGEVEETYAYPWCQVFISWVSAQAGAGDIIPTNLASCLDARAWYINRGRWKNRTDGYLPRPGDLIFFDWDGGGLLDHVGFVSQVANGLVYTIEGNSSDYVAGRAYDLNSSVIVGYGIPDYAVPAGNGNVCNCSTSYSGTYKCTSITSPLSIRKGHGTNYGIVGSIPPNAENVYVSKGNGFWAHVRYGNVEGYASMDYLKKIQTPSYEANPVTPPVNNCSCSNSYAGYYKCTSATVPLKIRQGHGTIYDIIGTINPGEEGIYVSAGNGAWAHVSYKGISGYACMDYLQKTADAGTVSGNEVYIPKAAKLTSISNSSTGLLIKWAEDSKVSGFYVYRRKSSEKTYRKIATITNASARSWTDQKVELNGTYYYKIKAYYKDSKGTIQKSKYSNYVYYRRLSNAYLKAVKQSASGSITASWNKNTKVSGYQLQYATNSSFSDKKSVTISSNTTTSRTIKNLTAKKTYYVRMRKFYKTSKGTKYYSKWSSVKIVKLTS